MIRALTGLVDFNKYNFIRNFIHFWNLASSLCMAYYYNFLKIINLIILNVIFLISLMISFSLFNIYGCF